MGRPATGDRKYNIENMWDTHHEIIRLLLQGLAHVDIAAIVGCTPQTVSNVANSPICREKLAVMRAARDCDAVDLAKKIHEIAPKAIAVIEDILDDIDAPEAVRLKAAMTTLDRLPETAQTRRAQADINMQYLSSGDIVKLKELAMQSGAIVANKTDISDATIVADKENK